MSAIWEGGVVVVVYRASLTFGSLIGEEEEDILMNFCTQ